MAEEWNSVGEIAEVFFTKLVDGLMVVPKALIATQGRDCLGLLSRFGILYTELWKKVDSPRVLTESRKEDD